MWLLSLRKYGWVWSLTYLENWGRCCYYLIWKAGEELRLGVVILLGPKAEGDKGCGHTFLGSIVYYLIRKQWRKRKCSYWS